LEEFLKIECVGGGLIDRLPGKGFKVYGKSERYGKPDLNQCALIIAEYHGIQIDAMLVDEAEYKYARQNRSPAEKKKTQNLGLSKLNKSQV
jgi:hypothetical protein